MGIRILIADDHDVVRQGLRMFLALDPELEVVGEAANGAEALDLAKQLRPDVVLMDLLMPVMDGITATAAIRREVPESEVLALTSVLEDASVTGAVRAGAIGYLLKDTQAEELRRAIKAAAAGQVQVSPRAVAPLLREVRSAPRVETSSEEAGQVHTFLIADIRGYTAFARMHGDEAAARLTLKFEALVHEGVAKRGGSVFEVRGDAVLVAFSSARQAMQAAVALQARLGQETEADPSLPLSVGMGLDAGEVVRVGDGYRGRALNLASRLCDVAVGGEVLASDGVVHLAGQTEGLDYVEQRAMAFKGFEEPIRVTRVVARG